MRYADDPSGASKPVGKPEPREPGPLDQAMTAIAVGFGVMVGLLAWCAAMPAFIWALDNGRAWLAVLIGVPWSVATLWAIGITAAKGGKP